MEDFAQFLESPVATVIFLITIITSIKAFNDPILRSNFILNPFDVMHNKKYTRMITHGLIHADITHLAMNMITFYFFAFYLERIMGHWQFAVFYFLTMIIAAVPGTLRYRDMPAYNSLGASGATSAVVLAMVTWMPSMELRIFFAIPMTGWLFAILYIGYSYYAERNRRDGDNIAHDAHLWGAVSGVVLGLIMSETIRNGFLGWLGQFM